MIQFTADTNVSLSGLSTGDLQIGSNSECAEASVSGAVLTVTDITDGSVFTLKTPAHNNALTLSPAGGALDLTINSGNISSGNITEWTLEASGNVNVSYTVGVAQANAQYAVKVNNVLLNNVQSNESAEINFIYNGGWSVKVFTVEEASVSTNFSGGGLPPSAYEAPKPPSSGFQVIIKPVESRDGAAIQATSDRTIILELLAGSNVKRMVVSEDPEFKNAGQEPFTETKIWTLSEGVGKKTVYVKFFTEYGVSSEVISVDIILLPPTQPAVTEPILKTAPPTPAAPPESITAPVIATTTQSAESPVQPSKQKPATTRLGKKNDVKFIRQTAIDNLEIYQGAADSIYAELAERIVLKVKESIIIAKQIIINIFNITINGIHKLIPDFIADSYNKIGDWIKYELLKLFRI